MGVSVKWKLFDALFKYRHVRMYAPDKWMVSWQFHHSLGYDIDWKNPKTFNEKLNWLKVYGREPLYTQLVDKVAVKDYVANKIGEQYIIPTLAVYHSVDEIDIEKLPNRFVLKCNHDSGSVVICKDKKTFNLQAAKEKLDKCLRRDYYLVCREWPYKNVRRCVFAEQYMEDQTFDDLADYKFICINGKPEIMYITVKADDVWENFYDMDFQPINFSHGRKLYSRKPISEPEQFELMKEVTQVLAEDVPNVRIDFYVIKGKLYFSEYTFYDWAGYAKIQPESWDMKLGDLMILPQQRCFGKRIIP